jgi:hypothetical protein
MSHDPETNLRLDRKADEVFRHATRVLGYSILDQPHTALSEDNYNRAAEVLDLIGCDGTFATVWTVPTESLIEAAGIPRTDPDFHLIVDRVDNLYIVPESTPGAYRLLAFWRENRPSDSVFIHNLDQVMGQALIGSSVDEDTVTLHFGGGGEIDIFNSTGDGKLHIEGD